MVAVQSRAEGLRGAVMEAGAEPIPPKHTDLCDPPPRAVWVAQV